MTRYLAILSLVAILFGPTPYFVPRYSSSADIGNADRKEKEEDKETNVEDYFPLEIGARWTYSLETYGEERNDNVFIVTGRETFDGVECIKVEQSEEADGKLRPLFVSCYTKDEKGVYLHRWGEFKEKTNELEWTEIYRPPQQILSYPLKTNKGWRWTGKKDPHPGRGSEAETFFAFNVNGQKTIETPAGKFKTFLVQRNADMALPFWELYAYSLGVGLVVHQILNRSVFKLKAFSNPGLAREKRR